jgi:hypothetical protein
MIRKSSCDFHWWICGSISVDDKQELLTKRHRPSRRTFLLHDHAPPDKLDIASEVDHPTDGQMYWTALLKCREEWCAHPEGRASCLKLEGALRSIRTPRPSQLRPLCRVTPQPTPLEDYLLCWRTRRSPEHAQYRAGCHRPTRNANEVFGVGVLERSLETGPTQAT